MTLVEIASLLTAIGGIIGLGLLHQRTKKSDAVVERSGIADEEKAGEIQRWEQLEKINTALRADMVECRAYNSRLLEDKRLDQTRMDKMDDKIDALTLELARVNKLVNGA